MDMKLNALHLQDWQAHEDLQVPLSPGVTTIMGATDRGKSSILRALEWVARNSLTGEAFVRHGCKATTVTLSIGDSTVQRTKGGRTNTYELDGAAFSALGIGGVPEPIAKLLHVCELNFQGQHDSPFWFGVGAGEVSRQLNAIVDLQAIDTALEHVASASRQAAVEERVVAGRVEALTQEVDELRAKQGRVRAFRQLRLQQQDMDNLHVEVTWLANVLELAANAEAAEAHATACQGVLKLAEGVCTIQQQKTRLRAIVADCRRFSQVPTPPDFSPVQAAWENWTQARDAAADLERARCSVERAALAVGMAEDAERLAKRLFHKETAGKPCPLCGQTIQS